MTEFEPALKLVLQNEGGYANDKDDLGGETYKGVARNMNSSWSGWTIIDLKKLENNFPSNLLSDASLDEEIKSFYKVNYWDAINASQINDQRVANSIFDFAVNAGIKTSSALAQKVVGEKEDGKIGPDSITAINKMPPDLFLAYFTLAKIARYVALVKKNRVNQKFFYGWIRRALGDI